ncbi:MAG TPA: AAA family ATPase [Pyrinomonadaceae bacterium]|jgi:chromosome partitioning protein
MYVIAIANQKGGVGKTTLTRELAACCAIRGYQTLIIDCDPQKNQTTSWLDMDAYEATLSHVLIEPEADKFGKRAQLLPLGDVIIETNLQNLDLVPADIRLARFELQPDYLTLRLRGQLEIIRHQYDLVFLDCPPQLGKLLNAALYSANYVLIPCKADPMTLEGLADLIYTLDRVKENANPNLEILGAVMTLYKPQRGVSAEAREAVEEASDLIKYVFDTNLHDYAKFVEAPTKHLPVVLYAPNHAAADQLESLTEEVLERLKLTRNKIAAVK